MLGRRGSVSATVERSSNDRMSISCTVDAIVQPDAPLVTVARNMETAVLKVCLMLTEPQQHLYKHWRNQAGIENG